MERNFFIKNLSNDILIQNSNTLDWSLVLNKKDYQI